MNLKSGLFQSDKKDERVFYEDENASKQLANMMLTCMPRLFIKPIIIVCIGTDRSTGDSLGPLIGFKLKEELEHFHIYGTLEEPVHAVNLEETLTFINEKHHNPFIIAIDACLGRLKSVGYIQVAKGSLKPGAGVNKELPAVGDMHITGIVNVSGFMEFFVLQNTRLHLVMSMADIISKGIIEAEKQYLNKRLSIRRDWLANKNQDSAIQ
ncbi:spore protease YyaC [Metabacillus niabensis]|uniref:Sporulation protein YyaC n=1 Tax=Metabacillus niabensis TaxID=324854 RepID=A0ABT9Z7A2_9BACI|nr:spore protease YyaC [Metabacillus niabensis]MDQ0228148.1 putative sporulation protein YyaC [Metabacillus niabensis]